jgi:predicted phage gp36 major capsid-like protein
MATTVASLLRPEIEKMLDDQRSEIQQLRKMVEALVLRQSDEMASENKALKARVAELEKKLQKRDASADSSSSGSSHHTFFGSCDS